MLDPLDTIEETRETLRSAYKAAAADEDREAIRKKIDDLADLQEDIILERFPSEAKKIASLTDTLAKIIKDLCPRSKCGPDS
jgi:hypothetical protein